MLYCNLFFEGLRFSSPGSAAYENSALGVDSRVVTWVWKFLLGCTQRVGVGRQLSEEVRVMSGVLQGSVLGPLLFLAYVNYIWRNIESTTILIADDCITYRKIINNKDMEKFQIDVNRLGEWAVENAMIINPAKSKAICFMRAQVTESLNCSYRT
jgi:hypothetical protein